VALDLWFRDDVARILASTHETMRGTAGSVTPLDEQRASAYQQGFEDALRSVAVAFGVAVPGNNHRRAEFPRLEGPYRE